jgi:hypothetical protein
MDLNIAMKIKQEMSSSPPHHHHHHHQQQQLHGSKWLTIVTRPVATKRLSFW